VRPARAALRQLTPPGWGRLNEVLAQVQTLQQARPDSAPDAPAADAAPSAGPAVVTGLLGAPEGAALRRVLRDANSLLLVEHLAGAEGRPLRRAGVQSLAAAIQAWHEGRRRLEAEGAEGLRAQREAARQRAALRVLGGNHLLRLLQAGLPGLRACLRLAWLSLRVGAVGILKGVWAVLMNVLWRRKGGQAPAGESRLD